MATLYDDLVKRARRLAKSDVAIPSLEWEKEAHRLKLDVRKAYAQHDISHDEMVEIIRMLEEVEYDDRA